jgi:hypothetical protein
MRVFCKGNAFSRNGQPKNHCSGRVHNRALHCGTVARCIAGARVAARPRSLATRTLQKMPAARRKPFARDRICRWFPPPKPPPCCAARCRMRMSMAATARPPPAAPPAQGFARRAARSATRPAPTFRRGESAPHPLDGEECDRRRERSHVVVEAVVAERGDKRDQQGGRGEAHAFTGDQSPLRSASSIAGSVVPAERPA